MKRRLLASLLAACMVLALVSPAWAEGITYTNWGGEAWNTPTVQGGNYRLTKDVTWTLTKLYDLQMGKTLRLDLDGHTLTIKQTDATVSAAIGVKGTMILEDSSPDQSGKLMVDQAGSSCTSGIFVNNGGCFKMTGGTLECAITKIYPLSVNNGTAAVSGGKILAAGPTAAVEVANGTFTLTGSGAVESTSAAALDLWSNAKVEIAGGSAVYPDEEGFVTVTDKATNVVVTVSGGNFAASVAEYVIESLNAELYHTANDSKALYSYSNLKAGLAEAKSGDVVTLLSDSSVAEGEMLSIAEGVTLVVPEGKSLSNSGTLEVNGTLFLPSGTTAEQIEALKPMGNGRLQIASNQGGAPTSYYWVCFADGEERLSVQYLTAGSTPVAPDVPNKEGYTFKGWFPVIGVVSGSVVYTAQWEEIVMLPPYIPPVNPTIPSKPTTPAEPDQPDTPVVPGALPFVDVGTGDWFYEDVAYVYAQGIMTGSTATSFAPNDAMTRAMVWTVLGRMDGENVDGGTPWYALAQSWAVSAGVSDGTEPNSSITREQLVTMLYRQAGSPGVGVSELALLGRFTDGESVSSWAEEAMAWAVSQGILTGDGDLLKPQATATRAQVAAILARYCEADKK